MKHLLGLLVAILFHGAAAAQTSPFADTTRSFFLPTLTQNLQGQAVMYWTERDASNTVSLFFSTAADGQSFNEKQLIFADPGLGNGRLARPKLLFKKNGDMVAVFSFRPPAVPTTDGSKPKRSSEIRFSVSKDGGKTWSSPQPVDTDTTPLVRGFFDSVVLPNDELAVAYLKDVKGSTKHEERDLRMAFTKNGVFQPERLIDAVVCDCCNISLLVDGKGQFHAFYRDNNDDIRDIAHIVSKDNGLTFSNSKILHDDKWEIKGCPHTGAVSVANKSNQYVAWFSGTKNEAAGIRLADGSGRILKTLDPKAKNAAVAIDNQQAALIWEQPNADNKPTLWLNTITKGKVIESKTVNGSTIGQNASVLLHNGKILMAYEVPQPNKRNLLVYEWVK